MLKLDLTCLNSLFENISSLKKVSLYCKAEKCDHPVAKIVFKKLVSARIRSAQIAFIT